MLFPSLTFILFLLAIFPVAWALRPPSRAWQGFMLAASYLFYAAWDWRFVPLIIGSTLVNAACAAQIYRLTDARWRRLLLALGVAANLAVLGWFKYYGFVADATNHVLAGWGVAGRLPLLEIVLPVGISFFTFQAHQLRGRRLSAAMPAPRPLLDVALYLAFFPHLVAGPIVRAAEFLPQLAPPPRILRRLDRRT